MKAESVARVMLFYNIYANINGGINGKGFAHHTRLFIWS